MHGSSILAVGVGTIAATLLLAHHGGPVEAAPSVGIHGCSNTQVVIEPMNKGLGAALGHVGRWYQIHELRGSSCSLRGFPGVELLDRNFHTVQRHVGRGGYIIAGTVPIRRVVLNKQQDAYFALEYTDVPGGSQPCRSVPYLMVTPPNDRLPVVTYSGGIAPCPGEIGVSIIEPMPSLH